MATLFYFLLFFVSALHNKFSMINILKDFILEILRKIQLSESSNSQKRDF